MKRKVKKFNEGGKTYDKEDKGLFGGTINYREEDGRKYVAGKATPFDRNPSEQRYYSMDDVKGKLSGLFGGKKEAPKSVDSEPVGDANKSSSYNTRATDNKSEEAPRRQITDYIKKSEPAEPAKPAGTTHVNEGYKEEPAKKVTKKVIKKEAAAPKASMDAGIPKDTKSTRMPSGYDKLDLRSPEEKYKPGISKERQEKADKAVYAGWRKNRIDMTKRKSAEDMRYDEQGNAYKRGGSVKSASARADGCAIRGKTRA